MSRRQGLLDQATPARCRPTLRLAGLRRASTSTAFAQEDYSWRSSFRRESMVLWAGHLLSLQVDGYRRRHRFFVGFLILERVPRSVDVVRDNPPRCFVSPSTPSQGSIPHSPPRNASHPL